MKNGDLSNEVPPRILVNVDTFTNTTTMVTRKFKVLPKISHHVTFDKMMLSKLYMFAVNKGVTLEMFSYELDQDDINMLHAELDRVGTNPFRYATAYASSKQLVKDLAYRPEVLGVYDIPSRELMYGSRSYNFG